MVILFEEEDVDYREWNPFEGEKLLRLFEILENMNVVRKKMSVYLDNEMNKKTKKKVV